MVTGTIENLRTKEKGTIRFRRVAFIVGECYGISVINNSIGIDIRFDEVYRIVFQPPCVDGLFTLMHVTTHYGELDFEEVTPLEACELLNKKED